MHQGVAEAEAAQHRRHQDHNAAQWVAGVNLDDNDDEDNCGGGEVAVAMRETPL